MAKIEPDMLCRLKGTDVPSNNGKLVVTIEKQSRTYIHNPTGRVVRCWLVQFLQPWESVRKGWFPAGAKGITMEETLEPIPPLPDEDETPREVDLPVPSEETTL